ncbi:hypothetical protein EPN29_01220 [bacterium]|nr:MAG: hypothetical protein EPN29_01220 [bacterium]
MRTIELTTRRDLLQHSFYRRWTAGELTIDELRDYACQYGHVVAALPAWLREASRHNPAHAAQLERHAREEDGHIALWRRFADALGVPDGELAAAPNSATRELLRRGGELSGLPAGVAAAWAIEVQTPEVSAEKLRGLKAHFGIDRVSGGEYFDVHATRDLVHSAELEQVIGALPPDQHPLAQRTADEILDGLWDVLSSVERAA